MMDSDLYVELNKIFYYINPAIKIEGYFICRPHPDGYVFRTIVKNRAMNFQFFSVHPKVVVGDNKLISYDIDEAKQAELLLMGL
jgi:hypothetical protein